MSYTVLYRKLRPRAFKDVIGQDHIVTTIINQITRGRVSHAYLFCGTRGTGKTSTAKIFAKAINCLALQEGEPCNTCESCLSINNNRSMNIIEIDAASNNGVDNIREIREEVKYPPTVGTYKVYIIDEVHMLSAGAFNALLKTLEEPPEHVVFILATTDPQKVPVTILSRCQRFDFKRITVDTMVAKMKEYMIGEEIAITDEALRYIGGISDGAMRDALSVLDQTIAFYYGQEITLDKVLNVVGSVDNDVFFKLTEALLNYDSNGCMEIIQEITTNGRDINQFTSEYILHLRNLLVAANIQKQSSALDLAKEAVDRLKAQSKTTDQQTLMGYITAFSTLNGQMKYASNERVLLEVSCIKLCNPMTEDTNDALMTRVRKLEAMAERGFAQMTANTPMNVDKTGKKAVKDKEAPRLEKAIPKDIEDVIASWEKFTSSLPTPLRPMMSKTAPKYLEGDALTLVTTDESTRLYLKEREATIESALGETFGKSFNLAIVEKQEYDNRHNLIYGVIDEEFFAKTFTDLLGDDIIIE